MHYSVIKFFVFCTLDKPFIFILSELGKLLKNEITGEKTKKKKKDGLELVTLLADNLMCRLPTGRKGNVH